MSQSFSVGKSLAAGVLVIGAASVAHGVTIADLLTGTHSSNLVGYWPMQEGANAPTVADWSINNNYALVNSIDENTEQYVGSGGNGTNEWVPTITTGVAGPNGANAVDFPGTGSVFSMRNNRKLEPGIANVGQSGGGAQVTPNVAPYIPLAGANPTALLPASGDYNGTWAQGPATYTGSFTGQTPMTIVGWIRPETFDSSQGGTTTIVHVGRTEASTGYGLDINQDTGTLRFMRNGNAGGAAGMNIVHSVEALTEDEWQFVALTFDPADPDANNFAMYINGTPLNMVAEAGDTLDHTHDWLAPAQAGARVFTIGGRDIRWNFDGQMAHIAILNDALTESEIQALYAADTVIPEPGGLAVLVLSGLMLVRRRGTDA